MDDLGLGEAGVGAGEARGDAFSLADAAVDEDNGTLGGAEDAGAAVGDGFDGSGNQFFHNGKLW